MWLRLELLRPLPLATSCVLLDRAARLYWRARPAWRRERVHQLAAFLPPGTPADEIESIARERAARRIAEVHLRYLVMRHDVRDHREMLAVEGWEHVEAARAAGRGAVLITAHVGFYRALRWHLRSIDAEILHLLRVGWPERPPRQLRERMAGRVRRHYGLEGDRVGGESRFSLDYLKPAFEVLRRNGLVEVSGDGRHAARQLVLELRGRPRNFPIGGLTLGLMAEAPVLPCFTVQERPSRFRLWVEQPLAAPPGAPRALQTQAMARDYVTRLERFLAVHPAEATTGYLNYRHPGHRAGGAG